MTFVYIFFPLSPKSYFAVMVIQRVRELALPEGIVLRKCFQVPVSDPLHMLSSYCYTKFGSQTLCTVWKVSTSVWHVSKPRLDCVGRLYRVDNSLIYIQCLPQKNSLHFHSNHAYHHRPLFAVVVAFFNSFI